MIGVVLQSAYRLRRHLWLGWPLSRWLEFLLLVAALVALIQCWPRPWPAALLGLLLLGCVALLTWAKQRRYVHFEAKPFPAPASHNKPSLPPLGKEELVPVRASGWFTVEGQGQHYIELEADFETVGTREHIVLGRVRSSRFLLLGRWPGYELGWWYIFFRPDMIRRVELGHLHFGPQPCLALQVVYAPDNETAQTVYLSFDDGTALRRVWHDLLLDAPPYIANPAIRES